MPQKNNKKTTYKKRGWAKKKQVAFVTPSPDKIVAKDTLGFLAKEMNKQKKQFFDIAVKGKIEDILPKAYKEHSRLISTALETELTNTTVGVIDHIKGGITNRGAQKYGFFKKESTSSLNVSNAVQGVSEKVRTRFVTGQPSTNSVLRMSEIFGSSTYTLFNTETDFKEGRSDALSQTFGFNQKSFTFLSSVFTPNVRDYKSLFGMDDYSFPKFNDQTAYGLAMQEEIKFKITNLNKYLPINIDVHLVEFQDRELTNSGLCNICFSKNLSKNNSSGTIPEKYQLKDSQESSVGGIMYHKSVLTSKKARLEMSPAFRQNAKIAKTIRKKLDPGVIWDLGLTFHLGAGICLDQLFYDSIQTSSKLDSQPSTYAIIFECVGTDTTLVEATKGVKQEHIGTGAGSFCWECKKLIKVANNDVNLSKSGFESSKAAIKLYSRDVSLEKEFNVDFDNIAHEETVNGFYEPIRSSILIKEGGPI